MIMNVSKTLARSAGLALALSAAVLSAQGFGPMMGGGRGPAECGHMPPFLDLTEAQQASLKTLRDRHQASLDAKHKAAEQAREELRKAMPDSTVSDAKLKELHLKVAGAMADVMLERRAMDREFEALLTTEQKAALGKRPGGHGRPMGMGMGPDPMDQGGCGF
jgi:Spy/CpxP family protein refolding chaperone